MMCNAMQQNDEMVCAKCRLRWDRTDPEPPPCPQAFRPGHTSTARTALEQAKAALASTHVKKECK